MIDALRATVRAETVRAVLRDTREQEPTYACQIGSWTRCPGCGEGTELDEIGAVLFAVGHFNCSHCGAQWEDCSAPDCFGYDPDCPCRLTGGWRPYRDVVERLSLSRDAWPAAATPVETGTPTP